MAVLNKRLEAIAAYLKQVGKDLARGDSTEHTHRRARQNIVEALANGSTCTNEPDGRKHGQLFLARVCPASPRPSPTIAES